jgi:hypothetical protein
MSFHASGDSHLRLHYPVACLHLGPKLKLPFNRTNFLEDVVTKKKSLLTRIDMTNEHKGGFIAVVKTELMIKDFLNSKYFKNRLENPKFVDYYNLILTNPYSPSSDFKEFFPYKDFEIDAKTIEDSIKIYEGENLYKLLIELKNKNTVKDIDLTTLVPYDESFLVMMSGNSIGLRINLNDIEATINKLPGAKTFFAMIKKVGYLTSN